MDEPARLYLSPDGRWGSDPKGATLRLDSTVRPRAVAVQAQNVIYRPDGKGGWQPILDDQDLPPLQRGLIWEVWQTQRRGEIFHAFRGVRAVDDQTLMLLDGLLLRDATGDVIADPKAAGRLFLLSRDDTKQFLERLRGVGGKVLRAELTPEAAERAAARAEQSAAELEALITHDRQTVTEARNSDFSGVPAFQRRHALITEQFAAVRAAFEDCERAAQVAAKPGLTVAEQAAGEGVLGRAREALQAAGALLEEREMAESEIARWQAFSQGTGPDPHRTPAARALLFRELGRVLAADGMEVEATTEGVRVRTPVGWIALGPSLTVESIAGRS